jgi:hypothetical protein
MADESSKKEEPRSQALKELDEVLEDLIVLLKNPEVIADLTARGVNTSLALVGVEGMAAYIHGDKMRAVDDLSTVAEEIATRLASSASSSLSGGGKPS